MQLYKHFIFIHVSTFFQHRSTFFSHYWMLILHHNDCNVQNTTFTLKLKVYPTLLHSPTASQEPFCTLLKGLVTSFIHKNENVWRLFRGKNRESIPSLGVSGLNHPPSPPPLFLLLPLATPATPTSHLETRPPFQFPIAMSVVGRIFFKTTHCVSISLFSLSWTNFPWF